MEIYHQYVRLRKDFGRYPVFVDEGAEMLADIRPNEEHAKEHIERNPVTTVVQVVPEMSEHEVNTTAVVFATKAMNHVEGGWPKEVDYTEAEHVIRYRKKVEKDEEYIKSVTALGAVIEDLVKANNAVDIYEEYFAGKVLEQSTEAPSAKTLAVLRDPCKGKRGAQYLSWHPDGSRKVAVAYSILEFQQQPENSPMSSYIWDVSNPNTPDFELIPQSQLTSINFNLKDTSLVGAGQYNGQFAYFDMRKGSTPVEASPVEHSHRDPVYDFAWLQSKTGTECMSVSTDGSVLWWDIRKLGEPTESLVLKERGSETVLGAMSLEYNPQAGPTKFMIGTEQGNIMTCNRKAKNPQDRVGASFPGHHGPVYGLVRNPFYPKYFLSIGDWTARIWNEDLKTPIMTSKYHSSYLTGGRWSPTRPGVFYTIKMNGCLDVWDYFYKQNDPTLQVQVTDQPLTSLEMMDNGRIAAVGSADGSTTIVQFSDGLVDMQPNEKQALTSVFERETNREKNLEKAVKEAKVKARKEAAKTSDNDKDRAMDEQDILKLEKEFHDSVDGAAS
ncbi:Dynein, 70 kDa intermediate chain, flagellar outer arm [Trebouxia sp. C0010 RCD-2024]